MKERIKNVRTLMKLSRVKFSERIGISESACRKLESGENSPSEQTLRAICSEFGINRIWLETGVGDMYAQRSRDEELAAFFGELLAGEDSFKRRVIGAMARMTEDEWLLIQRMAERLLEEQKKADP